MQTPPALLLLLLLCSLVSAFVLEGSDVSFVKLKPWQHVRRSNNTLLLEFNTNQPDGLVLYSDDGGDVDFFELKLVEGSLRLRYNLGEGTQIMNVAKHLNDGLWHRVEIRVGIVDISLTIDGFVTQSRTLKNEEFNNGGAVFIGGLPSYYNNRLSELSLPSVVFEPRFRGAIRNVVYADGSSHLALTNRPQDIVEWKGLVSGPGSEACERHDPCLHGGFCISTDSGPLCDCKHIDYEGTNCEREKAPAEGTFRGAEFIGYDFRESGGEPIVSTQDEISFSFKTKYKENMHDGLLFYSGDGVDYLALSLRDGRITISINLGSGPLDAKIHPDQLRFDDNQWHSVRIHRKILEMSTATSLCHVTANVDGIHFERWTLAGGFTLLASNRVTIGGYDMIRPLPGIKGVTNFIGCLRKVEYRADTLRLSLLELARAGNRLVTVHGRLTFQCQEENDSPFEPSNKDVGSSYTSSEAVMKTVSGGTVTFTTPESFLVLPRVNGTRAMSLSVKIRTTEPNGLLFYSTSDSRRQNFFAIELIEGHLYAHVETLSHLRIQATTDPIDDGEWHQIRFVRNGRSGAVFVDEISTNFNTKGVDVDLGELFVGGVLSDMSQEQVWSMNLKYGFVGCLRALSINDNLIDMASLAQQQDTGSVRSGCHVGSAGFCASNPCLNGGRCKDGWGRFLCDCTVANGAWDGVICQREIRILSLDGSSDVSFENPLTHPTEAHDIELRFKSNRGNGVILQLSGPSDFIEISLEYTRLKLRIRMSDREKILQAGRDLNDNRNHVVKFVRRGNVIKLKLDDIPPVVGEILTRSWSMLITKAVVGSTTNPFSGKISFLKVNGESVLESVSGLVDISSLNDYIGLPQLRVYSRGEIYMSFKGHAPGLIFYNGGVRDFISLEVVEGGKLLLSFDSGRGLEEIGYNGDCLDNRWHPIEIHVDFGGKDSWMKVDGKLVGSVKGIGNEFLNLNGILYVGGVPGNMYNSLRVASRQGFRGCVGSLEFAGEYLNPLTDALVNPSAVTKGCKQDVMETCTPESCLNGGICSENLQHSCDCEMTTYTGPTCALESISYEFWSGYMSYRHLRDRRDRERIVFGIATADKDGVVLKIDSKRDYLQMDITGGGRLRLKWNDGNELMTDSRINDREYRVVKVYRTNDYTTFQVGREVKRSHYGGSIYGPTIMYIGGTHTKKSQFKGVLSGLVVNGERLLDYASEKNPRIRIHGSGVEQLSSISSSALLLTMQKTTAGLSPGLNDDLIFSGDVKCHYSDDEDCQVASGAMTTDDLITPVYVPSPPKTTTTITTTTTRRRCEDDEDCFEELGSGEFVPSSEHHHHHLSTPTTSSHGVVILTESNNMVGQTEKGSDQDKSRTPSFTPTTTQHQITDADKTHSPKHVDSDVTTGSYFEPSTIITTQKTSTSTRFVPPHPPSLPPYIKPKGPYFDFDATTTTTTTMKTKPTEEGPVYMADGNRTLVIIIVVAVLMIIIVSVLILFFMCKRRDDPIYKMAEPKFEPQPPPPQPQRVMQGPRKTGVKEWYV